MADDKPMALTHVPETILKKRRNNEEWAIKRREQLEQRKLRNKENKKLNFKRAEQFIKEYRSKELDMSHMKRRLKRRSSNLVPEHSLLFIVRISGGTGMHSKARKILHKLKLWKNYTGVFVKANEGLMDMLSRVEPYVTYGYPNLKSVKELVYKKGRGKIDNQMVPLTDNNIIEQALGNFGIISIEDLVHEISTGGLHFKEVTNFLWPFKLNKPKDGLQGKKMPFKDGGDSGNRGDEINELINKMN
ncbi:hypothetical protein Syun_013125 [Stephania yunnanensis]|uniref:Uncharacterized protein n=1 Tax=Stephania yunnanensis TaxID=152371 RepID=A0AAP0PJJ5_9MAGN